MLFISVSGKFSTWLAKSLGFELLSNFLLVGAVLFLIVHSKMVTVLCHPSRWTVPVSLAARRYGRRNMSGHH